MKYILKGIYKENAIPIAGINLVNFKNQGALDSALQDLYKLEIIPTEIGVDILLLAEMVYLMDTGINREEVSEDGWSRELHIKVPVSNVALWNKCVSVVKEMLDFLTGDIWTLEFEKRNWTPIKKQKGMFSSKYAGISLFSGGLDSLIGALDHLSTNKIKNKNLFVSFAGDGSISKKQGYLFNEVSKHYGDINRLRFQNIKYDKIFSQIVCNREDTTRSRSFLFIAIAALAGSGLDAKIDILIPENGIMSLNVPLTPIRLGALSTRTTHPHYIELWNKLLSGLDLAIILKNPYWNKTKGEMLKDCKNKDFLQTVLDISSSCSHPASARWHKKAAQHCGYCIPCIIRRAAIYFAFTTDSTEYLYDSYRKLKKSGKLEQVQGIKYALHRLKQSPSLSKSLIHQVGNLGFDPIKLNEYEALYKRGMQEIADFFVYWGIKNAK